MTQPLPQTQRGIIHACPMICRECSEEQKVEGRCQGVPGAAPGPAEGRLGVRAGGGRGRPGGRGRRSDPRHPPSARRRAHAVVQRAA
eukprot:scaffold166720_cov47-Prasinocladus_malaysianus.AAC.3